MMDFFEVIKALEKGEIRVAEKVDGAWKVNAWIKEAILEGFRLAVLPGRQGKDSPRWQQCPLWVLPRTLSYHDAPGLCQHRRLGR